MTSLIHFEHLMPPLSELGLEHVIPIVMRGGGAITAEDVARVLKGLASGADAHAARRIVAVAMSTGEDLLAWEVDSAKSADALRTAALLDFSEAKDHVIRFFSSLGLSLDVIPTSLGTGDPAETQSPDAPMGTPES